MAFDIANGGTINHRSRMGINAPYAVEFVLDWADALTTKGSALAASDVFSVINVPANTLLHGVIAEVMVVGDATAATIDVDVAEGDSFIDGANIIASTGYAAFGTNGLAPFGANTVVNATADTVDVKIATLSGTLTSGKVRVVAFMTDIAEIPGPASVARDVA